MYALIDWHILSDGDPNRYLDEAKLFFAEMAGKFRDCDHVLYEICNEPNGVDWAAVKSYAEQVIPVIREKDPKAVVIVAFPSRGSVFFRVLPMAAFIGSGSHAESRNALSPDFAMPNGAHSQYNLQVMSLLITGWW